MPGTRAMIVYGLILFAVVVGLYWSVFNYPHVQDDWRVVNYITFNKTGEVLYDFFDPGDRIFYRPLSMTYHVVMVRLFGANAIGFHAVTLILMFVNSLFVALVTGRLMRDQFLGMLTGILYAAATSVHIVPMLWAVGINEFGGMFCFLSAILLFDREKYMATALCCLMGLLFKEAVWFLPLFLLVLLIRKGDYVSFSDFSRKAVSALWPVAVVSAVYVFAKHFNPAPLSLPQEHPYAAVIEPMSVARNLLLYVRWMTEALIPPLIESSGWARIMVWLEMHLRYFIFFLLAFCAIAYAVLVRDVTRNNESVRQPARSVFLDLAFLGVWFFLGIFVALCLRGHQFRYYLIYGLIPFLFFVVWFVRALLRFVVRKPRHVMVCLILLGSLNVALSGRFIRGREAEGLNAEALEGNGWPFRKGLIVRIVHRDLLALHPELPRGATLVFGGFSLWLLYQADAVQVWYQDPTIKVFPLRYTRMEKGILSAGQDMPWNKKHDPPDRVALNPGRTFFFRLENGHLVEFTDEARSLVGEIDANE